MSITFDSDKWSNPAKARDYENSHAKPKSLVLVPAKELRYFKVHSTQSDALFSQIVSQDGNARPVRNPVPPINIEEF
jgi:hypothetical protein